MVKRKKETMDDAIEEKMKYIGLETNKIPKSALQTHKLNFRVLKGFDEKRHKQYRYININDIDILLTPTNRLNDLKEKYEKAKPLYMYLDPREEENIMRHTTFLNMLKKVEISEIKEVEKEQEYLSKKVPFKVKYKQNYLWQIYYSESAERYFMLVPTEDTEYSTFFYLLKKKIENDEEAKIFVPVSYVDYSGEILKKSEIRDLENYLWLFTKDYPSIYEVYDQNNNLSLQVVGESQVYGKVKTLYKLTFQTSKEAMKFYKLLKALFILQTELPYYYSFSTSIDDDGKLEIYLNKAKVEYENLAEFVLEQYMKSISLKENIQNEIEYLEKKLETLKNESAELENEYFAKEKQISTFLECKKSFFGKVKYYFKFGKKSNKKGKNNIEKESEKEEEIDIKKKDENKKFKLKDRVYTLDELVISYKELEIMENNQKNTKLDINAIKLKNKNLKKKIENATAYIEEINEHKKSIFEFWKYSNKDEVMALEEGEKEEVVTTEIEKKFDYDEDFEKFGERVDKNQRKKFTDSELDSCYVSSTEILDLINKMYTKKAEAKDFSDALKELKEGKDDEEEIDDVDALEIYSSDRTEEKNLGNKIHREKTRILNEILEIKKESKGTELRKSIINVIKDLKRATKKNSLDEDMYVYKAMSEDLDLEEFQTFSLNEELEVKEFIENNVSKRKAINLYRIKLPKGTNFIAFTNIVFYDNKNMTLPIGMNQSHKILIDLEPLNIKDNGNKTINKAYMEDDGNDFSKLMIREINIHELEVEMDISD